MPHGKRYQAKAKLIDRTKRYTLDEAITLVRQASPARFDAAVEAHLQLGIDPKKGDQQVRSNVVLPHGTGKTQRVVAFVGPDREQEARNAGADIVGGKELIAELRSSEAIAFDVAVATPDMMKDLASIAKLLGPRGLMPTPKNSTVTTKVAQIIHDLKRGMAAYKNDDTANVHQVVGRVSWDAAKLRENLAAFLESVRRAKPPSSKGTFIKSMTLTSTMGPGVRVHV